MLIDVQMKLLFVKVEFNAHDITYIPFVPFVFLSFDVMKRLILRSSKN